MVADFGLGISDCKWVLLSLLRAGMRFTNLLPEGARGQIERVMAEKGMPADLGNLKPEMVEDLIEQLGKLSVDVGESGGEGAGFL